MLIGPTRAMVKFKVSLLSPVHIGSGSNLTYMDYFISGGFIHRINLEKILQIPGVDINNLVRQMKTRGFRWLDWCRQNRIEPATITLYRLRLTNNAPDRNEIREILKDIYQRPYLPGSTIKGAIRSGIITLLLEGKMRPVEPGLLRKIADELIVTPDNNNQANYREPDNRRTRTVNNPGTAIVERRFLGSTPHEDLLQEYLIADSSPFPPEHLAAGKIYTFLRTQKKWQYDPGLSSLIELIMPAFPENGVSRGMEPANVEITITKRSWPAHAAQRSLQYAPDTGKGQNNLPLRDLPVKDLLTLVNDHYRRRWNEEKQKLLRLAYEQVGETDFSREMENYYQWADKMIKHAPERSVLLQVGFAAGYEHKTVTFPLLRRFKAEGIKVNNKEIDEQQFLLDLRRKYGFGKCPRHRDFESPFPKSCRLIGIGKHILPAGWLLLQPVD